MDADKKNRDAKIDEEMKANKGNSEATDHVEGQPSGVKGTRKTVTDPTTGKQVEIEDVNADFMKSVDNPQVCCLCTASRDMLTRTSYRCPMQTSERIL